METEQTEQDTEANENSSQPKAVFKFAPGSGFFVEQVFIPEGVSKTETQGFLETQLEGISPFNVEQLNWGAFVDHSTRSALLYAVLKEESLISEGEAEGDDLPVFPSFLPFLGYVADKPKVVCGVCERTVSLFVYEEAGQFPMDIYSVEVEAEEFDDEFVTRVRADLLREQPHISVAVEDEIYRFSHCEKDWKQQSLFVAEEQRGGKVETTLSLQESSLCDIREQETKKRFYNSSKLALALWFGSAGSLVLVSVLAVLSIGKLLWDIQIESMVQKTVSQQEKVQQIEQKSRSLSVFEDGASGRLQPLAMLELVNRLRPDGLFFSKVTAFEGKKMEIEGAAEQNGTTLVNRFKSDLGKNDKVSHFNLDITRISQGATFFKLTLEFNDLDLADVGAHK